MILYLFVFIGLLYLPYLYLLVCWCCSCSSWRCWLVWWVCSFVIHLSFAKVSYDDIRSKILTSCFDIMCKTGHPFIKLRTTLSNECFLMKWKRSFLNNACVDDLFCATDRAILLFIFFMCITLKNSCLKSENGRITVRSEKN